MVPSVVWASYKVECFLKGTVRSRAIQEPAKFLVWAWGFSLSSKMLFRTAALPSPVATKMMVQSHSAREVRISHCGGGFGGH